MVRFIPGSEHRSGRSAMVRCMQDSVHSMNSRKAGSQARSQNSQAQEGQSYWIIYYRAAITAIVHKASRTIVNHLMQKKYGLEKLKNNQDSMLSEWLGLQVMIKESRGQI